MGKIFLKPNNGIFPDEVLQLAARNFSEVRTLTHFFNNANYASVFAMELEKLFRNGKITTLCQTNMYLKQNFKSYKQE